MVDSDFVSEYLSTVAGGQTNQVKILPIAYGNWVKYCEPTKKGEE